MHSGTLEALTGCIFESNMAGRDGLAVTIFGLVDDITNLTFRTNSFYCASGKYGLVRDNDEVRYDCFLGDVQFLRRRVQEEILLILRWGHSILALQLCEKISLASCMHIFYLSGNQR